MRKLWESCVESERRECKIPSAAQRKKKNSKDYVNREMPTQSKQGAKKLNSNRLYLPSQDKVCRGMAARAMQQRDICYLEEELAEIYTEC